MYKRNQSKFFTILVMLLTLATFLAPVKASMGISTLEMENVEWIVPHVTKIGLGYEPDFTYRPDGTMQVLSLDTEEYSDALLYVDNSTGEWVDPVEIADPQYGAMNPRILVDSENQTHVLYKADNGGPVLLNKTDDTWDSVSLTSSGYNAFVPQMDIGPDDTVHCVYYWTDSDYDSYTGGIVYTNTSHHEFHFIENPTTRFDQFPDVAVDSKGLVHIVYEGQWNNTALGHIAVRDLFYQTFDPNNPEDHFSTPIRLTSVQSTSDYVQRPQIECDNQDNIHVVFLETEPYTVDTHNVHRYSLKYMRIDGDPGVSDHQIISKSEIQSHIPSLAIDSEGDVHVAFGAKPQTEYGHYYVSDIMYASNKSGTWQTERLTNQPYTCGWPHIAIHPITDEPTVLYLIKQEYTTDHRTMEYLERKNDEFGHYFNLTSIISSPEEQVRLIEEEAYQYIEIIPNQPILLNLEVLNPYNLSTEYNVDFNLIENDFVSLVNGTTELSLNSMEASATQDLDWWFSVSRGQMSELEVQVSHNGEIIGKIIYQFNIGKGSIGISIPFGSSLQISFLFVISVLIIIKIHKRT